MLSRRVLVIFLVCLGVTACSSDSADTTGPDTVPSTTVAPTTTTTPPPTTTSSSTTTTVPPTTTTTVPLDPLLGLGLEPLAGGLERPTFVVAVPGTEWLAVGEAIGRIRLVEPAGGLLAEPFLNIRNKVGSVSIEQGLLGLAFHPGYTENGRLFVYYTNRSDDSVLAEYRVGEDPAQAIETEERIILQIEQPDIRHNAGMLQFGPDGYLYISTGDGGAGGASVHGQDPSTLLAAILRIDVDGGDPYAIPPDNPFVGGGGAPEVWAYGLRNPWRFSIDPVENLLYIGDVGQESREEINVVALEPAGYNFGWPSVEGTRCFLERNCDPAAYTQPVLDYSHDDGLSVTGGYVYRGAAIPELVGHYFYADWVRQWIRSFRYDGTGVVDQQDWTGDLTPGQINSFGLDHAGELMIATWDGDVARVIARR
ncbi:MAG: PQQ-dependent sugar dehydrogenase [Acidimicrobiia bacterium]|nr:PQQ-dependent sugar dehydrogenase [Acidimicrobiia bacterium]